MGVVSHAVPVRRWVAFGPYRGRRAGDRPIAPTHDLGSHHAPRHARAPGRDGLPL